MRVKAKIMDAMSMHRALVRIAHEIIEHNNGAENVCLIGIKSRGVPLANMIADNIRTAYGVRLDVGTIDISFYRDDIKKITQNPIVNSANINFSIKDKHVILVDDVLFTGRTVRCAIDALIDIDRPKTIQLAVMVDRGHRELPIRADYVGKNLPTSNTEAVGVMVIPLDEENGVLLYDIKNVEENGSTLPI